MKYHTRNTDKITIFHTKTFLPSAVIEWNKPSTVIEWSLLDPNLPSAARLHIFKSLPELIQAVRSVAK